MRAVLSTLLALHLALAAAAPHVHLAAGPAGDGHGGEQCALCVTRAAAASESQTPDVAPAAVPAGRALLDPGLAPVTGAPLGAIPGQSPPSASR